MLGTDQELIALVEGILTDRISPMQLDDLRWADSTAITERESLDVLTMYAYALRQRRRNRPIAQRKAMRLLRTLLSPEQRRTLRSGRYFYVTTWSGVTFRFLPRCGFTERVERHGKRWYSRSHFCLHDDNEELPPADIVMAHLLLIISNEGKFLAMANEHETRRQLWNGEYIRGMRRARIEREREQACQS